jgi:hypothetical protein
MNTIQFLLLSNLFLGVCLWHRVFFDLKLYSNPAPFNPLKKYSDIITLIVLAAIMTISFIKFCATWNIQ